MRPTSSLFLIACFVALGAATALASDEPPPTAVEMVGLLDATISDTDATWQDKWTAYRKAKDAISGAKGEEQKAAEAAYAAIQGRVAEAIRRDELPAGGWIMGLMAALLLWGGFSFHVWIASKGKGRKHLDPLEDDETWPLRPEDE